jgi:thiol-disulfide isomerase/thioredoxin
VMVIGSMVLLAAHRPERLAASTPPLHDEGIVILEPSEWIGKPFPLQPYLHPKIEHSTGRWVVVLYHHDCPKCQEALPDYERLAREPNQLGVDGILAVEVPPFGPNQNIGGTALKQARLSEAREWFVQAPVEIELDNGVVTSASLELPSIVQAEDEHGPSEASE